MLLKVKDNANPEQALEAKSYRTEILSISQRDTAEQVESASLNHKDLSQPSLWY